MEFSSRCVYSEAVNVGFWVFKATHQQFIPENFKVVAKKMNMNVKQVVTLFQGQIQGIRILDIILQIKFWV